MFKLIVNGKNGREESDFPTRVAAEAHFEHYKNLGHWGKEAHVVHHEETIVHHLAEYSEEVLDTEGNVVTPKVLIKEAWDETIPAWDENVPSEFSYVIEDHTAEIAAKEAAIAVKASAKAARIVSLKAIAWPTVDTVLELKAIVKTLVEEVLKDEV